MKLAEYESRIKRLALFSRPFDEIEDEINAAPLTDDQKAALWLLAWSYQDPCKQRRLARETLRAVCAMAPEPVAMQQGAGR
jgi:hypothetical protein